MTSLRSHIADVLWDPSDPDALEFADALLADPTLAAIIDLAAWHRDDRYYVLNEQDALWASPEVRALLAAWRADR